MAPEQHTADVVIVGTGPGGLIAALVARARGLDPLVIEKSEWVGGTTALSFGGLWLPNHPLMAEFGAQDSEDEAMAYLDAVVGDTSLATSRARKLAYIRGGRRMVTFLRETGLSFIPIEHYPDYYPEAPGGKQEGRMVGSPIFDARQLGSWQDWIRPRPPLPLGMVINSVDEFRKLLFVGTRWSSRLMTTRIVARSAGLKLRGLKPLVLGSAYIGQLLFAAQQQGIRIWRQTPLVDLLAEDGRVVGVLARRGGQTVEIRARHGVILNA